MARLPVLRRDSCGKIPKHRRAGQLGPYRRCIVVLLSSMRPSENWSLVRTPTGTDRETAALDVACPICGVPPGELCQDVVRGHIGPVERPHLYRTRVAAEV